MKRSTWGCLAGGEDGGDGGNAEAALCPDSPGSLWPAGFLCTDER